MYESSSEKSHDWNSYVNDSERKPVMKSSRESDDEKTKKTMEDSLEANDLDFMAAVSRIKRKIEEKK